MAVVSISLPEDVVAQVDRAIHQGAYSGRSELVRAALREFFQHQQEHTHARGRCSATLTVVYAETGERRVSDLRHEFSKAVKSMMHGHAGGECVDLYMLEGQAADIKRFADSLRASKEVHIVQLAYTHGSEGESKSA